MLIVYKRKGSGKERWLVPEGRSSERKECLLVHEGRSSARKDDLYTSGQKFSKESSPDLISGNKKKPMTCIWWLKFSEERWLVPMGRSTKRKDNWPESQRGKMTCTWGSSERQDDLYLRKLREARWLGLEEDQRGKMTCTWSSERQDDLYLKLKEAIWLVP